ncbi:hypothetical protein OZX65_06400 [Leuconostocaceae bacterium ESL0723]|nr:hypothetical protein OZX65_06400 [Leuconostocaceae bacterium ESL0723]
MEKKFTTKKGVNVKIVLRRTTLDERIQILSAIAVVLVVAGLFQLFK